MKVDFNLPDIGSTQRIDAALPDIIAELKDGYNVILCTHWGRPRGFQTKYSTRLLAPILNQRIKTLFPDVSFQAEYWNQYDHDFADIPEKKLILLENTRFEYNERGDHSQRLQLSRKYADLAQYLIDDAFSLSHRREATNSEIRLFIPHRYGDLYKSEVERIEAFVASPRKPFTAILGGGKADTKFPLLQSLLPFVDHALVGGVLSYPFLKIKHPEKLGHINVLNDHLRLAHELLDMYPTSLIVPHDTVMFEGQAMDIGVETRQKYQEIIANSHKIFWNGPVGNYKLNGMQYGTQSIVNALTSHDKSPDVLVAGGDTLTCIRSTKIEKISYGGGATTHKLIQSF